MDGKSKYVKEMTGNNNTRQKRETRVIHFDFLVSFSIVCLL